MPRAFRIGLPLLAKELYEQSARWQTYAYRVAYALLLFMAALWFFRGILEQQASSPLEVLGQGREMFMTIVKLQLAGVYLFMPALTCNAITLEKERNTLGTLLLTKLSPFTIILEKLLSRMIPMIGFQLLSLPLLAYAYTLGGVTTAELVGNVWLLGLATVQVGSFAICCSVFASTTVGAFVMAYVLGVGALIVFPFACCTGPVLFSGSMAGRGLELAAVYTMPASFTTIVCLTLASNFLVPKAFAEPRNYLMAFFKHLDGLFHDMNQVTGGILLVNDNVSLPKSKPISWRETRKKSMGTVRYLFRILSAIEVPLLLLLTIMTEQTAYRFRAATTVLGLIWVLAAVLITVLSSSLIAGERSRQTLDVLLTAPMSGSEILREKLHGVWRMVGVLSVPLATIVLYEAWWEGEFWFRTQERTLATWAYVGISAAAIPIYLSFVALLGTWMGFQFRSQSRAILVTLGSLALWNGLPLWLGTGSTSLLIPSALIWELEEKMLNPVFAVVNLSVHLSLVIAMLIYFHRRADALLNRAEPTDELLPEPAAGTVVAPG